ncbi:mitochondrial chaperone BCS1-like [Pyrus ussuriensis x Pyrus communis]|uniref:Mitochondrial chaperone BCS1-like n=1 Tax=Pyrus ussuriensis x Pyrus communis TaxID=2448454 RepID=A0A5N5HJI7_9ROSA|nr:mitochondrial chaperone BCS1-like [Pyrus ussuriensis x Pyrus communis]
MALEELPTSKRPSWSPVPAYAVEEFTNGGVPNQMFKAVKVYVDKRLSCPTLRIKVSNNTNLIKNNEFESHQKLDPAADKLLQVITVDGNSQELVDSFHGVVVMWALVSSKLPLSGDGQNRDLETSPEPWKMTRAQATPAEVAGELMRSDDSHVSLQGLIEFLRGKTERT